MQNDTAGRGGLHKVTKFYIKFQKPKRSVKIITIRNTIAVSECTGFSLTSVYSVANCAIYNILFNMIAKITETKCNNNHTVVRKVEKNAAGSGNIYESSTGISISVSPTL
jgi:hypothetical protein